MKQFLEYVTGFDSEFPKRIRGASAMQIVELERLAGRELPVSYKNFLMTMGENDGGLCLTFDGTTNIEDVLTYYREEVATGNFPPPPDSVLIGFGLSEVFALDCRASGEPPVMFVDGDTYTRLFAGSLDSLLFNTAFNQYAMSWFPWEVNYVASFADIGERDCTPIMPNLARECGLEPLWFSDRVCCCAERLDVRACLTQYEGQGISARIAGHDRSEVARIGAIIQQRLGLRLDKWTQRPSAISNDK